MKKVSKIMMTAALAVIMVSFAGCSSKKTEPAPSPEITGEGVKDEDENLVMATNSEFPPYEFKENQELQGIDVEIAKAIAEKMGKKLVIEDMAFDSVIPSVTSGKADIGMAGITVTEDRLVNLDFSDPYVKASQSIIVKANETEIVNADTLVGKIVGVQLGTTGDLFAENIKDAKVERYNKGFEAVQALAQGKVDVVMIDDQVAIALAEGNADVKVLEEPFTTEEYAIAVKKGNTELVEEINKTIAELKESGKMQEIIDKYITAK